jgi:hypothetical protein
MPTISPCRQKTKFEAYFGKSGICAWPEKYASKTTSTRLPVTRPPGRSLGHMPGVVAADNRWTYFGSLWEALPWPSSATDPSNPTNGSAAAQTSADTNGSSLVSSPWFWVAAALTIGGTYGAFRLYDCWGSASAGVVPGGAEVPLISPSDVRLDMLFPGSATPPVAPASPPEELGVAARRYSV